MEKKEEKVTVPLKKSIETFNKERRGSDDDDPSSSKLNDSSSESSSDMDPSP